MSPQISSSNIILDFEIWKRKDDFAEDSFFVDDLFPSVASSNRFFSANKVSIFIFMKCYVTVKHTHSSHISTSMQVKKVHMFLKSHGYLVLFYASNYDFRMSSQIF